MQTRTIHPLCPFHKQSPKGFLPPPALPKLSRPAPALGVARLAPSLTFFDCRRRATDLLRTRKGMSLQTPLRKVACARFSAYPIATCDHLPICPHAANARTAHASRFQFCGFGSQGARRKRHGCESQRRSRGAHCQLHTQSLFVSLRPRMRSCIVKHTGSTQAQHRTLRVTKCLC